MKVGTRHQSTMVLGPHGHWSMVGGALWVLVNHGSWSSWPITKGCGGPSSPAVGGGAGCPWTFVGGCCHFLMAVVVGLMANHQWSWQIMAVGDRSHSLILVLKPHGHSLVVGVGPCAC